LWADKTDKGPAMQVSLNTKKLFEHFGDVPSFHAALKAQGLAPAGRDMVAQGTLRGWKTRGEIPMAWALPIIELLHDRGEDVRDFTVLSDPENTDPFAGLDM